MLREIEAMSEEEAQQLLAGKNARGGGAVGHE
jgi:hypothetical protein